jgi:hypothetical protein
MLVSEDSKQLYSVSRFVELMRQLDARPKVHIAYERDSWVHPLHDDVRVTFDRNVRAEPRPSIHFSTDMDNPVRPFGRWVILELKFTNPYPDWLRGLVQRFGLLQCGAAKYCEGVFDIGDVTLGAGIHLQPFSGPDQNPGSTLQSHHEYQDR